MGQERHRRKRGFGRHKHQDPSRYTGHRSPDGQKPRQETKVRHPRRTDDQRESVKNIFLHHGQDHLKFHDAEWKRGNAGEAWKWILKEALDRHERSCDEGKTDRHIGKTHNLWPLHGLADAPDHHAANDEEWKNRS